MGLSVFARGRALALIFKGDLAVGLSRGGEEIADVGYTRQSIRFVPQAEATVASSADVRFGPWREKAALVTGWLVLDDAGRELASGDLTEQEAEPQAGLGEGDEVVLRAGNLIAGLE